jgi:hypothetical protein
MKTFGLIHSSTSIRNDDSLMFYLLIISLLAAIAGIHYLIKNFTTIKQALFNYVNTYYSMLSRDDD